MAGKELRFVRLNASDIDSLIDEKNSTNTTRVINSSVNVLRSFKLQRNRTRCFRFVFITNIGAARISQGVLWWSANCGGRNLREKNNDVYQGWAAEAFLEKIKIDIVNDPEFKEANSVFLAMCAKIKKEGKGAVQHKEPLTRPDLQKLYMFFNTETAEGFCGLHVVFL